MARMMVGCPGQPPGRPGRENHPAMFLPVGMDEIILGMDEIILTSLFSGFRHAADPAFALGTVGGKVHAVMM